MAWDDGLDDISWAALSHAYGPAEDVPGLLRLLASSDPEERKAADWELNGNIVHQGTLYEATATACRYLGRLAAHVPHSRWTATTDLAYIAGHASSEPDEPMYAAIGKACYETVSPIVAAVDRDDVVQIGAVLALAAACDPLDRAAVELAVERFEKAEDPELKAITALLLSRDPEEAWRLAELRLHLIPEHSDLRTEISEERRQEIIARLPVPPTWKRRL